MSSIILIFSSLDPGHINEVCEGHFKYFTERINLHLRGRWKETDDLQMMYDFSCLDVAKYIIEASASMQAILADSRPQSYSS